MSVSVEPDAVTVKPPARAALEVDDRAGARVVGVGQRAEARTPVGALGAVVSTLTVVVIEAVLPTLSVPVSVSR